jgi:hypothetical protein
MKKNYQTILYLLVLFITPTITFAQWKISKLIGGDRGGMASFTSGSKVFFAGGGSSKNSYSSDVISVYDTEINTWKRDTLLNSATDYKVVYNDKWAVLYGGFNTISGYIQVYNMTTKKWEERNDPYRDVDYAKISLVGDKIIYAGGRKFGTQIDSIAVYDIPTKKMMQGAKLSSKRTVANTIINGSKIIYVGGYIGCCDESDAIEIYDVMTNKVVFTKMPEQKHSISLGIVNNKLIVLGGKFDSSSGFYFNSTKADIIDLATFKVTTIDTKIKTANMKTITIGNKVVFYGGDNDTEFPCAITYNDTDGKFTYNKLETSDTHYAIKGGKVGNKLILAGAKSFSSKVYIYDSVSDTWSNKTLSVPRYNVGFAITNNTLVIAGGNIADYAFSDEVDIYTEALAPLLATFDDSNVTIKCNNDKTASLTIKPTGGTGNYAYLWSNGATTAQATGLGAGVYLVTITDGKSQQVLNYEIKQPTALKIVTSSTKTDNTNKTGSATAAVTGGTSPYTYQWSTSPIQISATAQNLAVGNYTVTVTDNNKCISTVSVAVKAILTSIITQTGTIKCFDDKTASLTITPTGGTSPFAYKWSNGNTTASISNVGAGIYSATVTDTDGATSVSTSKEITQPTKIIVTVSSTNATFGVKNGKAKAISNGGTQPYTYTWNTNPVQTTQEAINLNVGNYNVTVSDFNGCKSVANITVKSNVGTNELANIVGLRVYPNPASNLIIIDVKNTSIEFVTFEIIDLIGHKVLAGTTQVNQINVESLNNGYYNLILKDKNNEMAVSSIVIQK